MTGTDMTGTDMTGTPDPRSLPWVTRLMAIDSTSRNSNLPLIETVADRLRGLGLTPHVRCDASGEKANLIATVPDRDGGISGGVVLSGHTDVVPVDGQAWSSDPFEPQVRDGRLYGRGACDMKGFLGVVLTAVPDLLAARLAEPVHLALSYDEEVGCVGGEEIVEDIAALGLRPRVCVVGEPSGMRVITAHKAITLVRVDVTGVAAHSSLTPIGVNAIEHAAPIVSWVRSQADRWREYGPFDEGYDVAYTTASVNMISGGNGVNIVPASCGIDFEFRSISAVDAAAIVTEARHVAADVEARMRAEDPACSVSLRVASHAPGLETATDSPAVALAARLGGRPCLDKVPYATEAGLFQAAGIETVVCGPGDIAQAHRADEFIELDQLRRCEEFVAALARELSAGPTPS